MILLLLFYYIGYWKLFDKMNIKCWKCLLPVYNEYLLCKDIDADKRFMLIYLFVSGIITLINFIYLFLSLIIVLFMMILPFLFMFILSKKLWMISFDGFIPIMIIYVIFFLIYSIMRIYVVYKLSLKFGNSKIKSTILGIFNFIGIYVLGFGNLVYVDVNVNNDDNMISDIVIDDIDDIESMDEVILDDL